MTTEFQRGPAKIYQFPTRTRPAPGGHREDGRSGENPAITTASATPAPRVAACGGAWYHEEALQDAGFTSKN